MRFVNEARLRAANKADAHLLYKELALTYKIHKAYRAVICFMFVLPILFGSVLAWADTKPAEDTQLRLMIYGDSLSAGYGLGPGEAFPDQLAAGLVNAGYQIDVINAGVSGDTTAGGRARLDWSLADKPDALFLALGGNDMLRGLAPKDTRANLDAMIQALQAAEIPILLAGMAAPRNMGADYVSEFDAIYPDLAAQYDIPLYPFFLDGVALNPALNQPDGLHPNAEGVAVMVDRILPSVTRWIDTMPVSDGDKGDSQ